YVPEVMKFHHHIENSRKNQTYNTPSICNLFLLAEQVKLMHALGAKEVEKQAREKADYIYQWAMQRPYLSCYVSDERYRSIAVATIDVDPQYNVSELCQVFRKRGWAYDIEGYRKLGRNQFRIGLFHNISLDDLKKLTLL